MRPNFFILGPTKCGTTTLSKDLERHPQIAISSPKEPMYFESAEYMKDGLENYFNDYFPHWTNELAVGDCRASHITLPFVAKRIAESVPKAKLIVILRNPIDRAFSHWWMMKSVGVEKNNFFTGLKKNIEAINNGRTFAGEEGQKNWDAYRLEFKGDAPVYLEPGHYADNINEYLKYFHRDQLLVLFLKDLNKTPDIVHKKIFQFLEVDDCELKGIHGAKNVASSAVFVRVRSIGRKMRVVNLLPNSLKKVIVSLSQSVGSKPYIDAKSYDFLRDYYEDHNNKLELLLDENFSEWNQSYSNRVK